MKILILLMSCNQERFNVQSQAIKKSCQRQIDHYKLNDYFDIYDYVGESTFNFISNNKTINLNVNDDRFHTYDKTLECLRYVNDNIEYDYIFRTNTSTVINIKLLYELIKTIQPQDTIWCSELYSCYDVWCPNRNDLYPRGNGLILSKEIVNIILKDYKNGYNIDAINFCSGKPEQKSDDMSIGAIMNMHFNGDYLNHIKSFTHGWYKSNNSKEIDPNNSLCNWNNENDDPEFLSQFITIQIKNYINLNDTHIEKINHLTDKLLEYEYNVSLLLNLLAYSILPSVFIGYFKDTVYTDYCTWYVTYINNKINNSKNDNS